MVLPSALPILIPCRYLQPNECGRRRFVHHEARAAGALAATASQPEENQLLSTTLPTRRLSSKAVDRALSNFTDGSAGWDSSFDDELLLLLASETSLIRAL